MTDAALLALHKRRLTLWHHEIPTESLSAMDSVRRAETERLVAEFRAAERRIIEALRKRGEPVETGGVRLTLTADGRNYFDAKAKFHRSGSTRRRANRDSMLNDAHDGR